MINFFGKKKVKKIKVVAPIKGEAVSITQVSDPTFSEKMLGDGVAIIPAEGKVTSPVAGEVGMVFETRHAVSITSDDGVELLIHVGIDTVTLGGNGFEAHVKAGDRVEVGDLLLTVDLDVIKEAGLDSVTPVVICNTDDFEAIELPKLGAIEIGEDVIEITPKKN